MPRILLLWASSLRSAEQLRNLSITEEAGLGYVNGASGTHGGSGAAAARRVARRTIVNGRPCPVIAAAL